MFRTALRNVLAHKGRLLMTALAVLLGTAFVSGTLVFTDTVGGALKNSSAKSLTNVSVAIQQSGRSADHGPARSRSTDPGQITQAMLDKAAALPGVAYARPVIGGFAGVADRNGKLIGNGFDNAGANYAPVDHGTDPENPVTKGRGPATTGEIALDSGTAAKGGYQVGDTVRIAVNGPVLTEKLVGIFDSPDGRISSGGSLVLFDNATAQRLYATPGTFQEIDLKAAAGTGQQQLLSEVSPLLPAGGGVETITGAALVDQQAKDIASATSSVSTALLAFAGIALFVGIFIIANTFTMLVAQRTRELALMRAIGASRRQVTRAVQFEALFIGVFAGVTGLVAGIGIAIGMQAAFNAMGASLPSGPLVIEPRTILVSLVVGVLVTLLAAWLPSRRAAKIPPIAALSSVDAPTTQRGLLVRNCIGAALTALGVVLVGMGAAAGNSSGYLPIGIGAALTLIGVFVLTPLLSRPVIALSGPLLNRLFGVSGKLARQNAVRNPRRTAATASALTIGLTLISALTILGASMEQTVAKLTTSQLKADYSIALATRDSMAASTVQTLAKVPGVTAASPISTGFAEVGGSGFNLTGVDPATFGQLVNLPLDSGSTAALSAPNSVLVRTDTAKQLGLKVGSAVQAKLQDGSKQTLTVAGVYQDNHYLADMTVSAALLGAHDKGSADVEEVLVKAAAGPSPQMEQSLVDALGNNPIVEVHDKAQIQQDFSSIISTMLNIMYGLLAMAVLIAVLGVVNTLAMSVFERKREIGMLRAIGLDRVAVKRMVRLEAVVISLFGGVLGLGLGAFLAWAVGATIHGSLPAYSMAVPWLKLSLFLLTAGLVGLLAALWPSRSAARLNTLDAIKAA